MGQWSDDMGHWVYFVRSSDGGPIKIGLTVGDPQQRIRAMQTSAPFPLICIGLLRGGRKLEADLHERFNSARLGGEWFRPVPELVDYIRRIQGDEGPADDLGPVQSPPRAPGAMDEAPDVLTVEEAAKFLRISRMHAYESVRAGVIPSLRIGRRILVPKAQLLSMLHGLSASFDPSRSR